MSDRPKFAVQPIDPNTDSIAFVLSRIRKLEQTRAATAAGVAASPPANDEPNELKWRGATSTRSYASVVIGGTVQPWAWVNGGLNTQFQYGLNDGVSPVVVDTGLIPGDVVTIAYLTGTTALGIGDPNTDAGGTITPSGGSIDGVTHTLFPTAYTPGLALVGIRGCTLSPFSVASPSSALGHGGLVGAFTNDAGAVIGAIAPGNGGTFVVPTGATTLQLGINDTQFSNNIGSYTVSVTVSSGARPSYVVGDVTVFQGAPYVCIVNNPNGVLPPSALYWTLLSGFPVKLASLVDGQVLTWVAADASWENKAPAVGGASPFMTFDTHPTTPDSHNDEFETSSLDASWTVVKNNAAIVSLSGNSPGSIWVKHNANTGYVIGKSFVPGSADFSVTLKGYARPSASFDTLGLQLSDTRADLINSPGTANGHCLQWTWSGAGQIIQLNKWVSGTRTQSTGATLSTTQTRSYLHLQRVAGAWTAWYSFDDGGCFTQINGAIFGTPTVNFIVLVAERYGATTPECFALDFVRVNALFL